MLDFGCVPSFYGATLQLKFMDSHSRDAVEPASARIELVYRSGIPTLRFAAKPNHNRCSADCVSM